MKLWINYWTELFIPCLALVAVVGVTWVWPLYSMGQF